MAVAALPDSRRALSASADKALKLWDLETGNPARCLHGRFRPFRRRRRGERSLRCRLARWQAPYFTALDVTSRCAPGGV
jgi:WD40 repeat protein